MRYGMRSFLPLGELTLIILTQLRKHFQHFYDTYRFPQEQPHRTFKTGRRERFFLSFEANLSPIATVLIE
jgi:hypothetical protein